MPRIATGRASRSLMLAASSGARLLSVAATAGGRMGDAIGDETPYETGDGIDREGKRWPRRSP